MFHDFENYKYIYQYKDHLGNIRLSYTRNPEDGSVEVLSSNDYYPFGFSIINISSRTMQSYYNPSLTYENYKYNGKELQETGMYDYGARFYMPDIGRWMHVAPLVDEPEQIDKSPYAVFWNNPRIHSGSKTTKESESHQD